MDEVRLLIKILCRRVSQWYQAPRRLVAQFQEAHYAEDDGGSTHEVVSFLPYMKHHFNPINGRSGWGRGQRHWAGKGR